MKWSAVENVIRSCKEEDDMPTLITVNGNVKEPLGIHMIIRTVIIVMFKVIGTL